MVRGLFFMALVAMAGVTAAAGQSGSLVVSGTIVDAETGNPLAYASVSLEPAPAGVLPGGTSVLPQSRVTTSNTVGEYRFEGITEGDYRLHVQRIGYRSRSVELRVRAEASARVSVGLQIKPVALESVTATGGASAGISDSYARRARELDDLALQGTRRIAAEQLRQRLFLATDVRSITHADVSEGISLGETDLFRAMQRFAGVTTADEWSAELWTRGATWDQTRVYFDGVPLFNALHALGVFSGVNSDAVGAAFLHPGAQPVSIGGAAAGALDIRSRSGSGDGQLNGLGELSLASARLALDRRSTDADHAWMLSARRTYIDLATRMLAPLVGEDTNVPYTFFDVAARGDLRLSETSALEASGLIARDHAHGEIPDVLENTRAKWGGGVARVTLANELFGLRARHTVGFSQYSSQVREVEGDDPDDVFVVDPHRAADNGLRYYVARGEWQPFGAENWSAGYEAARYTVQYRGDHPALNRLPQDTDSLRYDAGLNVVSAWLQRRLQFGERAGADLGLRAETGSSVANRPVVALAPRLGARLQLSEQMLGSISLARSWQYTQALAPAGIAPIKGFASDFLWLLAGDSTNALRSDVASAGLERWIGDRWIVAMNGYLRRATGMAIPDPQPGTLQERALSIEAENRARGVELSLRKLSGRWTGSVAYTYSRSQLQHDTLEFAAPADQRHALDATLAVRLSNSWQIGTAYTISSGTPYTRMWKGLSACDASGNCVWQEPPRQEQPAAFRRNTYQSLDANIEWLRRFDSWRLAGFLQIRNLLNHQNQGRYVGAESICFANCGTTAPLVRDDFLPALPTIPLLGLRFSF